MNARRLKSLWLSALADLTDEHVRNLEKHRLAGRPVQFTTDHWIKGGVG